MNEMGFYEALSQVYDVVFPRYDAVVDFLARDLVPGKRILDLACGTGTYALALAEIGFDVTGVDLDEEMIRLARQKAINGSPSARFIAADMRDALKIAGGQTFDLVCCIGNSLVHLQDRQEAAQLISDMHALLVPGGRIVLQTIHFQRVFRLRLSGLPTIHRPEAGVTFVRNYRWSEGDFQEDEGESHGSGSRSGPKRVDFDTVLTITRNGKTEEYRDSVPLLALGPDELLDMVRKVGFTNLEIFGEFDGSVLDADSFAVIIRAQK